MERKFHFFKKCLDSYCQYRRRVAVLSIVVVSFFVFDGFSSNEKRGNQTVYEQIDKKIEKYIVDQYEKNIFPDCKKFAAMSASYDKLRLELSIQNHITKLLQNVMGYGEELSVSYQGEKDYILSKINSFMELQQAEVFKLQYPDGDPAWTKDFVIDLDSVERIYKELDMCK